MMQSKAMQDYFDRLDTEVKKAYLVADKARTMHLDPEDKVDIPLARNMAERVEGLISFLAPQIVNSGVSKRIQELEKKYGFLTTEVALLIAKEVAEEKFCKFKDKREAMEVGIRTGFAYHTAGIVAASIDGLVELRLKKRADGKEYFAPVFAGPIRGAGGTAIAICLLITDYVRQSMGYDKYDPTPEEVKRFQTELEDYHERITNLQYHASNDEIEFLIKNCPIEVSGDPTEKMEVSNFKDLPRIETNRIRGGVCLAVSMLALKAPKLWKEVNRISKEFDMGWGWLEEFLKIQKKKKSKGGVESKGLTPDYTFISDLVAGRPVLTHPLRVGGFRLRYGRSRVSGYSAAGMNPATMLILENFIATGTQLKVERPGKAAAMTPCDTIDGPIVRLENGTVIKVHKESEIKPYLDQIKEILFLGDFLVSYGDFIDRAHMLVPVGYVEEWWIQELEKATVKMFGTIDYSKLEEYTKIPKDKLEKIFKDPILNIPTGKEAFAISENLNIALHPEYIYYWNAINKESMIKLIAWLRTANITKDDDGNITKLTLNSNESKRSLELVGVPHDFVNNEYVVINKSHALSIYKTFDLENKSEIKDAPTSLELVNNISKVKSKDKLGTFIGARMGRPEKAKMRKLTGSPHVLFPVGEEGGRLRSFQAALLAKKITGDFPKYTCEKCQKETLYRVCEVCETLTKENEEIYSTRSIDINHYFSLSVKNLGLNIYPDLIKGVRGTANETHIPENLAKGILRSSHSVFVNKDGTTRYDMSELPITHFKPKEIKTSVEKLIELGYEKDIHGDLLTHDNQILELRPQDLVLPSNETVTEDNADEVLFRMSKFIDDLLVKFYKQKPYYNYKSKEELPGMLVIGLAPHISAGMVGRVIGFSKTQAMFAHPLFHAAMRRDADGDEACVIVLIDALLNFSKNFLPSTRGARTMDAPLVLTTTLNPSEVDDMVHRMDVAWRYPIELYEAAEEFKMPWDVDIELLGKRLGTELQYEGIGYTHGVESINEGVNLSAYKILPSMQEKLLGQMSLAEKIRAVDTSDIAMLVIEKHLLKDIKGNLRKFSTQQYRCIACNKKYRRPPLMGVCTSCKGKVIFTISEGSIVKYLEPAISLAKKYDINPYTQQVLELTKRRVEDVFGKDSEKQEGLGKWFG